jgi:drug/metabolite transporter (DMT)-like permease
VRRVTTADLLLAGTVVLWALNFTVTRYVLTHGFAPLAYSTVRYGAAALLFSGLTYGLERSLRVRRRDVPLLLGAAAVGIWCNQVTYTYAVKLTSASTTALIIGATPFFAAILAFGVRLERLGARFWVAAAISFAGVALVAVGSSGGVSGDVGGDLLGVATAASWAAYSVAIAPLMRRYSPFRISAFVLVAGWIPLAATGAHQVAEQSFSFTPLVWACLAYAIFGPLVVTNVLWFSAVHRVGPSHATLFTNIQPFVAVVFAVLILSERLSALQVAGGGAIAVAIVLSRWRPRAVRFRARSRNREEVRVADIPQWYLKGDWFDVCNCRIPCPCTFAQPPTEGDCDGILAWHIREGRFGDVSLDGLNVVGLGRFEGNLWDGETKATMGIYMDEGADEGQREALQTIFGGQAGGWPGEFAETIGEMRGIEYAPITFEIADDLAYWAVEVPGKAKGRAEALTGPTTPEGGRVQVHNAPGAEVGPGQVATWGRATTDSADGFGFKWDREGLSSKHFPFEWSGP